MDITSPDPDRLRALSERISNTYTENLSALPNKERIHFLRRLYRITGDPDSAQLIAEWTRSHTIPAIRRRTTILRDVVAKGHAYPEVNLPRGKRQRAAQRNRFLEIHPEIQFFRRYLMDLFQAKTCAIHKSLLQEDWAGIQSDLQVIDFDSIYINQDVMSRVSSFAVNSVFFLRFLDIDEGISRRFLGYMRGMYFYEDGTLARSLSGDDFTSLVYNLTHVVIADSNFYQKWATEFVWIAEFVSSHIDEILRRCSIDVIAEVGLCLKLMKLDFAFGEAYSAILNHIIETYRLDDSLRHEMLARREHTNAVIMLLFSQVSKWHEGPKVT